LLSALDANAQEGRAAASVIGPVPSCDASSYALVTSIPRMAKNPNQLVSLRARDVHRRACMSRFGPS
jgi:hypothetical protein